MRVAQSSFQQCSVVSLDFPSELTITVAPTAGWKGTPFGLHAANVRGYSPGATASFEIPSRNLHKSWLHAETERRRGRSPSRRSAVLVVWKTCCSRLHGCHTHAPLGPQIFYNRVVGSRTKSAKLRAGDFRRWWLNLFVRCDTRDLISRIISRFHPLFYPLTEAETGTAIWYRIPTGPAVTRRSTPGHPMQHPQPPHGPLTLLPAGPQSIGTKPAPQPSSAVNAAGDLLGLAVLAVDNEQLGFESQDPSN